MGALPLGERRRRIRPTARGDRAHSQGGLWGVRGSRAGPWGILVPPAPHPRCRRGRARGRSQSWRGELIPRVSASHVGVSQRLPPGSKPFTPDSSLPRRINWLRGAAPHPTNANLLPGREVPPPGGTGSSGLVPGALGAARSCRCRWQGLPGESGWRRGAAPHPTNPNLLLSREVPPGGTDGGDGAVGGLSRSYLS